MDSNKPTDHATTITPKSQKKRSRKMVWYFISMLVMFGLGIFAAQHINDLKINTNPVAVRTNLESDGNKLSSTDENTVASIAEKVSPAVVSILTKSVDQTYFGPSEQEGAGTGIIVGSNGYILTNKHVVDGASAVTVMTADGTVYENVKVLGADPLNDVAFIKIEGAKDLPVAALGDSTTIKVGQRVVAIGNSLGQYQNTVTSGIISGTGRPITASSGSSSENLTDLLQTDAAINPGNSGGPLLNATGQVIGINTAVAADADNIGFAIPINATKGTLKGVLEGKSVQRAYLGVQALPVTPAVAKQYDLPVSQGAYIYRPNGNSAVVDNGPAAKAGIRDKDIITAVNGIKVGSQGSVSTLVGEYRPGDTIEISVMRGRQTLTMKVTLEAYATTQN